MIAHFVGQSLLVRHLPQVGGAAGTHQWHSPPRGREGGGEGEREGGRGGGREGGKEGGREGRREGGGGEMHFIVHSSQWM